MTSPGSPDLAALMAQYGIQAPMPSAGGGGSQAKQSPAVYFGETTRGPVSPRQAERPNFGTRNKTLEEANAAFYEMDAQQIRAFQERLVNAGILDGEKVRWGDYDDDTYSAFSAINERAAKFYAVGRKVTPNDVLGMIEDAYVPGMEDEGEIRPGRVSQVQDATTLEQTVQATARSRLGRKLSSSEAQRFVAVYQAMQRGANNTALAADPTLEAGGNVEFIGAPSAGAAADQFIDGEFAQEEAGQSTLGYLDALKGMMG